MANKHSIQRKSITSDDADEVVKRTFYVSWTPEITDEQLDSDDAFNKWVKKLHEHIDFSPEDSSGRPISAVALQMKASTVVDDKWKERQGITDFVFVATWKHAGQQAKMIDNDEHCDLGWVLGLQKRKGSTTNGDKNKGDEAPRLWFVPLDKMKPQRFAFTPRGGAKTSINDYVWHLTHPAINEEGDWFESNHKIAGIQYNPYDRSIVIEVTDDFLEHQRKACDVCRQLGI